MESHSRTQAKATIRFLAIAWTVYGALVDENAATGMVFAVLGMLLLVMSEFAVDALEACSISRRDERRIGWW